MYDIRTSFIPQRQFLLTVFLFSKVFLHFSRKSFSIAGIEVHLLGFTDNLMRLNIAPAYSSSSPDTTKQAGTRCTALYQHRHWIYIGLVHHFTNTDLVHHIVPTQALCTTLHQHRLSSPKYISTDSVHHIVPTLAFRTTLY